MNDLDFDVCLWASVPGSEDVLPELESELADLPGRVTVERAGNGVYAGIEWALPTAFVLFLAAEYISGILQEAGADHYRRLTAAISRILNRSNKIPLSRSATAEAKLTRDPPGALSVYYVVERGRVLKYVFDPVKDETEQERAVEAMMAQLSELATAPHTLLLDIVEAASWRIVFRFDHATGHWRLWEATSERFLDQGVSSSKQ